MVLPLLRVLGRRLQLRRLALSLVASPSPAVPPLEARGLLRRPRLLLPQTGRLRGLGPQGRPRKGVALRRLRSSQSFAHAAARAMAAPESPLLTDAFRAQHAGLRTKWRRAVASGGEESGFGPFFLTNLEIPKTSSPAERLGMARALVQD